MNATDYVKSSTNSTCTSVNAYLNTSSCYNNSNTHNYLYSDNWPWTVSPHAYSSTSNVFNVYGGGLLSSGAYNGYSVRPAFFLSAKTTLNGEGSEADPYKVSKYVEEVKEEPKDAENNDKNEVNVDNGQVVEVPSTSAQMSIIIASIGIIFVSLAIIITKKMTKKSR